MKLLAGEIWSKVFDYRNVNNYISCNLELDWEDNLLEK